MSKVKKAATIFFKSLNTFFNTHPVIFCIITSFILELTIESIAHFSLIDGLKFLIFSPIIFALNMLIITVTLSVCLLFKRAIAMLCTVFCVWLGVGIANGVILLNRPSPFTISDLHVLPSVLSIITVYLKIWQIVLIIALIFAAITGLVFFWLKSPKRDRKIKRDGPNFGILISILCILLPVCIMFGTVPTTYGEVYHSYYKYGFPYSFIRSGFTGIQKPSDYSDFKISLVLDELAQRRDQDTAPPAASVSNPNVIYVQLESFFDVSAISGLELSENPIPNFTNLKNSFPTGALVVPYIGSGTANTEFEVLTGMNTDHFAPGEYPYISTLRKKTCETVSYLLKSHGYSTFALHNHSGTFYDRNVVYSNLGFDIFTPVEYMYDVEYNELNWAKDKVLADEILRCTTITQNSRDFVFAVSVQPHGTYSVTEPYLGQISVTSMLDTDMLDEYTYYINQLYQTDAFIGDLISRYEDNAEPTVIVFYGDHLPDLGLETEDLSRGDLYSTEYVIWSNFHMEVPERVRDLQSYQLSSYVFDLLGMNDGIMFGIHEYFANDENYDKIMKLIEYDMLSGDGFSYKNDRYEKTDMTYGTHKISLASCSYIAQTLIISGENFNEFSVIYLDGKPLETVYQGKKTLIALTELTPNTEPYEIYVAQRSKDTGTEYTRTPTSFLTVE